MGFEAERDTLPFRGENAYASGVARRPRRPEPNESRKAAVRLPPMPQYDRDVSAESIPCSIDIPVEDLAMNSYMHSHIFATENLPLHVQGWIQG